MTQREIRKKFDNIVTFADVPQRIERVRGPKGLFSKKSNKE
jgi:hypothetical protein